jgi:hypothetical protein
MRTTSVLVLGLALSFAARADFSFTTTTKSSGGMMGAMAGQTSRQLFKGDKMRSDTGDHSFIMDFGAQAIIRIDHRQKTYTVTPFSEMMSKAPQAATNANVDVRETGQHKTINGFNCREAIMTIEMENPQPGGQGKMRMTMDMWVSQDVPGYAEMRTFFQKAKNSPAWELMAGRLGMQKAMAEAQQKMANLGVPVLETIKMEMAGNPAQAQQMAAARERLEAMKRQGGEQAKAAERALAMMGGGGAMMEMTRESSGFSTATIPASEFAPPAGYQKTAK